jgi:uncharacterized protein YbjT (DUF2867 family)
MSGEIVAVQQEALVVGATGNVGRHVVTGLVERGVRVAALVRDPSAARPPVAVTVVAGDLLEPAALAERLDGADAMFLVWPFGSAEAAAPLLEMVGPRLRRIVYLSSMSVRDDVPAQLDPISAFHAELERRIRDAVGEWTFLRSSGLATNTLGWAPQVRHEGVMRWVYADAARSLVHERDLAAVAIEALTTDDHLGAVYRLTGPEVITQAAQAAAIGAAIGRPVRFEEIPRQEARAALAEALSPGAADAILDGHAALARDPEPVTTDVYDVLGRPALPYKQWAADHAEDFR